MYYICRNMAVLYFKILIFCLAAIACVITIGTLFMFILGD